jgi:glycosyltransferase involved in cell wall biosynthesis
MADKEIRILHIDTEKTWRGGQQQAFNLHQGLIGKNIFSLFVCNSNSELQKRLKQANLPNINIIMFGEIDLFAAFKISKICKSNNINIIQAHSGHAISIGLLIRLFHKNGKLIGVRRVDFNISNNLLSKLKYNSKLLNKIVCVSDAIKNVLITDKVSVQKLLTIHDGININRFNNIHFLPELKKLYQIPIENIVVGTIAAFVGHKDYPNLINAAKIVCDKFNNVTFLALGDGELKHEMEILVNQLNIKRRFIFVGFKNNVGEYLKIFDIFVLSSKLEGLGTSILDAQSVGLPVVATKTGGIPEVIQNEKNGILVEPQNPQKLAQTIINLINDNNKRKRLGIESKVSVKKFSIENNIEQNINLYQELLNE